MTVKLQSCFMGTNVNLNISSTHAYKPYFYGKFMFQDMS